MGDKVYKKFFNLRVLIIMMTSLLVLVGCRNNDIVFFDSSIQSDSVQEGNYLLTHKSLREEERIFFSRVGCSFGSSVSQPDFRWETEVKIAGSQFKFGLNRNPLIYYFVRLENYYRGENDRGGIVYFSFEGNILNVRLTTSESSNVRNLQFELQEDS